MHVQCFNTMLVRALLLRCRGVRVAPEELRAREPMPGRLQLRASYYEGRDGRGRQVCLLMPPEVTSCRPSSSSSAPGSSASHHAGFVLVVRRSSGTASARLSSRRFFGL